MGKKMKDYKYIVWQEGKYYVSQCLNVNVTSFGDTIDDAISNLKEAVELYFEDEVIDFPHIEKVVMGEEYIHV